MNSYNTKCVHFILLCEQESFSNKIFIFIYIYFIYFYSSFDILWDRSGILLFCMQLWTVSISHMTAYFFYFMSGTDMVYVLKYFEELYS